MYNDVQCVHRPRTLNLRPCRPATDLSTDLMVSHLIRMKRSCHCTSRRWYTRLSSTILKSEKLMG